MFGPLPRKEARWIRRNAATIVLLFVLLPGTFAAGTVVFQQVIPMDTPVAVAPQSEEVTTDELKTVVGLITPFTTPERYDRLDAAHRALRQEHVYGVVEVPHGLFDEEASVQMYFYVDRSVVPYRTPSVAIGNFMRRAVQTLPADVDLERREVGTEHILSEYLVPIGLLLVVLGAGLVYVPHNLSGERDVLDRLLVSSSLRRVVASKILAFGGVLSLPFAVTWGVAYWFDYQFLGHPAVAGGVYVLTFVAAAALGTSVALLGKLHDATRVVNTGILVVALGGSSVIYPPGFFSPSRLQLARLSPLHDVAVSVRGLLLKDVPAALYAGRIQALVLTTALCLVVLELAVRYRRGRL